MRNERGWSSDTGVHLHRRISGKEFPLSQQRLGDGGTASQVTNISMGAGNSPDLLAEVYFHERKLPAFEKKTKGFEWKLTCTARGERK